jgi:hypothetical protein
MNLTLESEDNLSMENELLISKGNIYAVDKMTRSEDVEDAGTRSYH